MDRIREVPLIIGLLETERVRPCISGRAIWEKNESRGDGTGVDTSDRNHRAHR